MYLIKKIITLKNLPIEEAYAIKKLCDKLHISKCNISTNFDIEGQKCMYYHDEYSRASNDILNKLNSILSSGSNALIEYYLNNYVNEMITRMSNYATTEGSENLPDSFTKGMLYIYNIWAEKNAYEKIYTAKELFNKVFKNSEHPTTLIYGILKQSKIFPYDIDIHITGCIDDDSAPHGNETYQKKIFHYKDTNGKSQYMQFDSEDAYRNILVANDILYKMNPIDSKMREYSSIIPNLINILYDVEIDYSNYDNARLIDELNSIKLDIETFMLKRLYSENLQSEKEKDNENGCI